MKNIEYIIKQNRDFFDGEEPSEGHFERFSGKLGKSVQVTYTKRSIVPYLLRAAVVTLLVTLSSLWTWEHFIKPDRNRMSLGDVSPQYKEVENYYVHQVNLMEQELVDIETANDAEHQEILMKEIRSMDSVYIQLQKDLKANPDDERIINAMIEHYQTKLEVMALIVNQLKTIQNDNQTRNENEKVIL